MALPVLAPKSQISAITLPALGTFSRVTASLPFGVYASNTDFITGASDQVAFTYKMLGGDVLDIELTEQNVYAAYEVAVLEYSYILNVHQSRNVMASALGSPTGTFNSDGELVSGSLFSSSLNGSRPELMLPSFDIGYAREVMTKTSEVVSVGGNLTVFSASVPVNSEQQDYDLQDGILSQSLVPGSPFAGLITNKVEVKKVYYKSPRAMWRFYGYYGGINTVGNLSTYGQYADDSTFEVIPAWQNKMQAMAYEDNIYTRISHYSYEIRNNKLRLFPTPMANDLKFIWVEFVIPQGAYDYGGSSSTGVSGSASTGGNRSTGVNNMNTLPFANIPYENINSIGKQWIRRFALSICKEMLGQIRGKFSTVPIPGESVTLNASDLLSQAKEEMNTLREEMKTILTEMTYDKLAEQTAGITDSTQKIIEKFPMAIFTG
jgi:hypothetical protein